MKEDITGWTSFGSSEEKKIIEPSSFNYKPDYWLLIVNRIDGVSSTDRTTMEILQKVHLTTQEEINFEIHSESNQRLYLCGSSVDLPLGKPIPWSNGVIDSLYSLCVDTYGGTVDCNSIIILEVPDIPQDLGFHRVLMNIKKIPEKVPDSSSFLPFFDFGLITGIGEIPFDSAVIITATGNPLKVNISII